MTPQIRIAIDCMGGDLGLRASLPAAIKALSQFTDLEIALVGNQQSIEAQLTAADHARLQIVHAPDVVVMTDKPSFALRKKKLSSMRIAIDLLQEGKVDGVVSAGNTGALMAMGCYVLKTLPGIDRPAICSAVPSANGHCYLLDLGANVDSSAEHLHQFAIMGATLSSAVDGIENPRVAVLNIGEEEIKGNEQVKLATKLIAANPQINYIGSIEGAGLFSGSADVIVCDGFVGNVALKVCEGTSSHIADVVQDQFKKNIFSRLAAMTAMPVLKRIYQKLDPQQYNGASFLGLQGVVVKSHGSSTIEGFLYAIAQARSEVNSNMLDMISQRLAALSE
ncbi:MAG: phosphate acyltransferase PlsX [Pseudomonadales bacterium]